MLNGFMSLVGPRPERKYYIDQIVKRAPYYYLLHNVRPGITSLGMVKYGYAGNVDQMIERLEYDILYYENMSLASRRNVKAILFLDRKDLRMESERLVRYCEQLKIRMLMMPTAIDEVKDASFSFRYLPEVRIDDLLGREEIQINLSEVSSSLKDKVVMVTGAAGSIGSEICRQLCRFGLKQLVLFDSAETPMHNIRLELEEKFPSVNFVPIVGDVRMEHRVENVFKRFHPQYLFHEFLTVERVHK